jgi:hypothetical protein
MRNLIGRLLERSPAELDRIASAWGVTLAGRDRYADVAAIYREITDIWAARDVWRQLPVIARQLIVLLGRHGDEPRSPEELALELAYDTDEVREALRELYRLGVVSVDQPRQPDAGEEPARLYLPREMWTVFERVAAEQRSPVDLDAPLDELFAIVPYVEIEEAATCWGARVTPGLHARAELVNVIRAQIERPERVEREAARLTKPARALWQSLRETGGTLAYEQAEAASGLRQPAFRQAVRELGTRLLVWHVDDEDADGAHRLLGIPDGILHPQTPEPEPLPEIAPVAEEDVFEPAWVFPQSAAWDLLTVLREAVRGGPRWSGLVSGDPALQRRLADRLWRAELETGVLPTGYLGFIARIGALLGVLQERDGRAGPGPEAEPWRQAAFTTAQRRMVAAWTASDDWIEGRDRIELAMYGASWPVFRATLLRALADLDEDVWYDQERFVERLIASEPDLLRQAQVGSVPATQLTMRVEGRQRPEERRADVMRLVIDTTLETACVWLNLIERSHHIEDRHPVIRLTTFGRWCGGRRGEPAGQHLGPAPLAIGANLQILLYRPTPRRVWALSAFSEPRALDRVSTFALTASAVIRALASNVRIEDVTRFLESQSGEPLPQTVLYTLEEWDRGYHRVWLQRAVLLTPEDSEDQQRIIETLSEIGLDPQLLADGRIALVHDASDATERLFETASRALREHGFAALSRSPETRANQSR